WQLRIGSVHDHVEKEIADVFPSARIQAISSKSFDNAIKNVALCKCPGATTLRRRIRAVECLEDSIHVGDSDAPGLRQVHRVLQRHAHLLQGSQRRSLVCFEPPLQSDEHLVEQPLFFEPWTDRAYRRGSDTAKFSILI